MATSMHPTHIGVISPRSTHAALSKLRAQERNKFRVPGSWFRVGVLENLEHWTRNPEPGTLL
jgi:hypothetical protein